MKESDIESALVEAVKKAGGQAFKLSVFRGCGWPDRTCVFPDGKIVIVEVKKPGGRLSAGQINRLRQLQSLNVCAGVVWSLADVEALVEKIYYDWPMPEWFTSMKERK